ncbi:hypothetical protein HAZT_HAZT008947 [Hyalella azteca]|uniref:Ion transport domain-containing protein n=1 Tax=Hyalella azteca TaxID=294128 RepID=A0A6A0GSQ4_HYAAZ|nr:hypothetical protein HAZT_HAZT008947 [Hyalella azteca]
MSNSPSMRQAPAHSCDSSYIMPANSSQLEESSHTQHSFMRQLRFSSSVTEPDGSIPDTNSTLAIIGPNNETEVPREGEDNDKFDSHPRDRGSLPAYLLSHSLWFYSLDLFASVLLLSLAAAERPAVYIFKDLNAGIHATVELFALGVLGISIVLQLKWRGWRNFSKHTRSMIKCGAWLVMVAEAITVIIRNSSHFRATRALRPIFLLDNRYLGGVRRFMRQLLQSVPPVLEIMAILMLVLTVFTTLGYYLFSPYQDDPYFTTLGQSFVSLFVLLTTANFPDVMMPAYARNRCSAAFFILYLAVTLYCIMNFLMAIVFVVFSGIEKEKFRKLLLHKRHA